MYLIVCLVTDRLLPARTATAPPQTVDVQAKFVNGRPDKIEVKYVMRRCLWGRWECIAKPACLLPAQHHLHADQKFLWLCVHPHLLWRQLVRVGSLHALHGAVC